MIFSKRLPVSSLILLCRALKHNLAAGLTLRDVFRQQARRGPAPVRPIADRIRVALESGDSLQFALEHEKAHFPPLFLSLASVGEDTGNLPEVFGALEKYYQMQQRFWRQFVSQSIVPVLQFVAATVVIAGLLFILGLIAESTNTPPIDPLGLGLTGGRGALIFLGVVYGTLAALGVGYMVASRSLRQKAAVDRVLLRVPAVGPFLQALSLARLSLALRLTMDSSMPIADALALSLRATGNAAFAATAPVMEDALLAGDRLTEAMARGRVFPEDFLNIVATAEEGGRIPEVMAQQAQNYEEEAERRLALLTKAANFAVWLFVAALIIMAIFRIFGIYINAINQLAR
jgi:type IV pilus assembly protein PilC